MAGRSRDCAPGFEIRTIFGKINIINFKNILTRKSSGGHQAKRRKEEKT
jgi:hypothetical protein